MYGFMKDEFSVKIVVFKEEGLYKVEVLLISFQLGKIIVDDGCEVINLCVNNYFGLVDFLVFIEVVKKVFDEWGFGMVLVWFICGIQIFYQKFE